jgi:hypothetical protein
MERRVRWGILGNAWIARDYMIPAMRSSRLPTGRTFTAWRPTR